jgi:hypothetical protein
MTLEEFLEKLRKYSEQPKIWVVDLQRQTEFIQAYKDLSNVVLAEDPNANIKCEMHEINDGSGVITIESSWVIVREIEKFCNATSKANNFEVYPLITDKVRIAFMFENIYKRLA